jgi:hypothetical protein
VERSIDHNTLPNLTNLNIFHNIDNSSVLFTMVFPTKKITASVPTSQPPSAVDPSDSGSGLVGLLFAASQVETKPEAKEAAAAAGATTGEGTETEIQVAKAKVSSAVVAINSIGFASKEDEKSSSSSTGCKGRAAKDPFSKHDPDNDPSPSLDADASKTMSFPQILHGIISTPECQSIIYWLSDGFSFIIADKQRLSDEILPKYFRQALLNSFIRKLNRWGFRRIKSRCKGEESSFSHNHFIRDKPWLCMKMWCKSKPSYHKASSAKNRKKAQEAAVQVDNIPAKIDVVVPSQAPPSFVAGGGGGMVNARNRDLCLPACPQHPTHTRLLLLMLLLLALPPPPPLPPPFERCHSSPPSALSILSSSAFSVRVRGASSSLLKCVKIIIIFKIKRSCSVSIMRCFRLMTAMP